MHLRFLAAAAACAIFLAGCGAPVHAPAVKPPASQKRKAPPAMPTIASATTPGGAARDLSQLLAGPTTALTGYSFSATAYAPGYGLLASTFPKISPPGYLGLSSGALWLINPVTQAARNLMPGAGDSVEPTTVSAGGHWVLWGEVGGSGMGPQQYYLENLQNGLSRLYIGPAGPETDGTLSQGLIYAQAAAPSGCDSIVATDPATGETAVLLETVGCAQGSATAPPVVTRSGGPLPAVLAGVSLSAFAVGGQELYFAVSPGGPSGQPTTIAALSLRTGAIQELLTSPDRIAMMAADSEVMAFTDGSSIYAMPAGGRRLLQLGQGLTPTVSGPYASGGGQVYDSEAGILYDLPAGALSVRLVGPYISWCRGGTLYYAPLRQP